MAVFFHTPVFQTAAFQKAVFQNPVSTGVVAPAERLFVARSAAAGAHRLGCSWARDPQGRLIRVWRDGPGQTPQAADDPATAAA